VNQTRTEQSFPFFSLFTFPLPSSLMSVPSIRNRNRTSYL
jgi:hypothetical protein